MTPQTAIPAQAVSPLDSIREQTTLILSRLQDLQDRLDDLDEYIRDTELDRPGFGIVRGS